VNPRLTRTVAKVVRHDVAQGGLVVAGFVTVIFGLYAIIAMVAAFQALPAS
jgi:hypothetical protein